MVQKVEMNLVLDQSPLGKECILDKSSCKFLEENGILDKLKDERIKFV